MDGSVSVCLSVCRTMCVPLMIPSGRSVVRLFSLPNAHRKPVLATAFHSATNRLIS